MVMMGPRESRSYICRSGFAAAHISSRSLDGRELLGEARLHTTWRGVGERHTPLEIGGVCDPLDAGMVCLGMACRHHDTGVGGEEAASRGGGAEERRRRYVPLALRCGDVHERLPARVQVQSWTVRPSTASCRASQSTIWLAGTAASVEVRLSAGGRHGTAYTRRRLVRCTLAAVYSRNRGMLDWHGLVMHIGDAFPRPPSAGFHPKAGFEKPLFRRLG